MLPLAEFRTVVKKPSIYGLFRVGRVQLHKDCGMTRAMQYVRIGGKDYRKGTRRGNSGQVWYCLDDVAKAITDKWTVRGRPRPT